ncbi:hypothetical protein Q5752_000561 [Cryptotrichosporon argae]
MHAHLLCSTVEFARLRWPVPLSLGFLHEPRTRSAAHHAVLEPHVAFTLSQPRDTVQLAQELDVAPANIRRSVDWPDARHPSTVAVGGFDTTAIARRLAPANKDSSSSVEEPLPVTPTSETVSFASFDPRPRPTLLHRHSAVHGHHRGQSSGSLPANNASTSHLESTIQFLRPTTSMIRKKSGEVVKPSLKQRSMSTPDLTRRSSDGSDDGNELEGMSSTTLHEHASKSVRFAGSGEGSGLESVVLFSREQKVTAVSKAADPDYVGGMTETETENDTDASDFVLFRTRRNAAARAADDAREIELHQVTPVPRIRVDFAPDTRSALKDEYVVLERAAVQNSTPLTMHGTVVVRNIAFSKWVAVRFTLDNWQTVSEVSGQHVMHIPAQATGDEGWDRFAFSIKLEDYKRNIDERELHLCVRYTAEGTEHWDSNNGRNYSFTFKRAAPRQRPARPVNTVFGGNFMRVNDPLPPRQGRGTTSKSLSHNGTTKPWSFPNRTDTASPVPAPPPPASFRPPPVPDVHTHLNLSRWIAPSSPPQSPPKAAPLFSLASAPLGLAPETSAASPMAIVNGHPATVVQPPQASSTPAALQPSLVGGQHGRSKSWGSDSNGSLESTGTAVPDDSTPPRGRDGESTPTNYTSRSPEPEFDQMSSPETRPLSMKRSTGDLRALVDSSSVDLITPPSSNLSSPPSPSAPLLPTPMSPSDSASVSTGDSSPVNTLSSDSTPGMSNLHLVIDPEDRSRTLNAASYQEFLDKFCFFKSPTMQPSQLPESAPYKRPLYIPLSGYSSPTAGFPFYSHSSNSPRSTPTPTRQFDTAHEAFGFEASGGTPRPSPPNGSIAASS